MVRKFLDRFKKNIVPENKGNTLEPDEIIRETNALAYKISNLLIEYIHKTGRAYITGVRITYPTNSNNTFSDVKVELNVQVEKDNFVEPLSIEIPYERRIIN